MRNGGNQPFGGYVDLDPSKKRGRAYGMNLSWMGLFFPNRGFIRNESIPE